MSLKELQTHAARIVHAEHIGEVPADDWQRRFGYHPLDLESVQQSPIESAWSQYSQYGFLTVLWPEVTGEVTEIRVFVQPLQLTIVGDNRTHLVRDWLQTIEADATRQVSSPAELLADLVSRAVAATTVEKLDRVAAVRLTSIAQALRQCARWLNEQSQGRAVAQLILLAHRLDSLIDQLRTKVPVAVTRPVMLPTMLRAYATIATVMVVVVIVTLAVH